MTTQPRRIDEPRPGFFRIRLVKGGPFVGAQIKFGPPRDPNTGGLMEERSWMWETWIDGKLSRAPSPDPLKADVFRVWLHGDEINEDAYRHLIADREWCRRHAPLSPEANPDRRADPRNPNMESLLP